MIVEHSFVTTLDEPQAMQEAADFLCLLGFRQRGSAASGKPARKTNPFKALPAEFVPREIKLDFDRGRMTAAVSLEPKGAPRKVHRDLLLAVVIGLEHLLAGRVAPDEAAQPWRQIIDERARARRRQSIIAVCVLGAVAAAFMGLMFLAA